MENPQKPDVNKAQKTYDIDDSGANDGLSIAGEGLYA